MVRRSKRSVYLQRTSFFNNCNLPKSTSTVETRVRLRSLAQFINYRVDEVGNLPDGMLESNLFSASERYCNADISPKCDGIVPVNWFCDRSNVTRSVKVPSVVGIVPLIAFPAVEKNDSNN
jgi:hypothetical protein